MFIYIFRLLKLIFDWTKSPMSHFLWWYKWLDVNFNERWNAKNCVDFTPYVNMEMYICAELTWSYYPRFDFHNNILSVLLWYDTSFIHAWHRATHRFILRALTTLENLNLTVYNVDIHVYRSRLVECLFFCIVYWFLSRYWTFVPLAW